MLEDALKIINSLQGGFAVGVSGGADSMCLLSLILKAGKKELATVINVDHGIRQSSGADSLFVRDFCGKNGIKFIGHRIDVPAAAAASRRSIETEARIMRHAIFKDFCDKYDAKLLLAHNLDDNAESVLMHIFRGCGIRGLVGMSECDGRIIRPLINTLKSEIYEYMRQNNLGFVEDETNADLNYSRNRIRAIVSEVEKSFLGARGAINSMSKIAAATVKYLDSQLNSSFFKSDKRAVLLDKRALDGLLAEEYIYAAAKKAGLTADIEQKHIALVTALAGLETGKSIDLPHGLRVYNQHDCLAFEFFVSPQAEAKKFDNNYGEYLFGERIIKVLPVDISELPADFLGKARVDLKKQPSEAGEMQGEIQGEMQGEKQAGKQAEKQCEIQGEIQGERCFVDLDKLDGTELRTRREGDRFHPCGGRGKKLKEFFNEKKMPLRLRDSLPLIASCEDVLVVPGLRVSEKVKITSDTVRAAEIILQ